MEVRSAPPIVSTNEGLRLLASSVGHEFELAVRLGLQLGASLDELAELLWEDVHTTEAVIALRGSSSPGRRRRVPLPPRLVDLLRRHKASPAEEVVSRRVRDRLRLGFPGWAKSAAGRPVSFGELSRAFPVLLLTHGVPVLVVMELVGRPAVTPATYVDGAPVGVQARAAVSLLEAHLYGDR